jgi:hypothetical protein
MYNLLQHTKTLQSAHRVCLCVSCGSQSKEATVSLNIIKRLGFVAET